MKIFGLNISSVGYDDLNNAIFRAISEKRKLFVTYATAAVLNNVYSDKNILKFYSVFDIIHPDGVGVYFASKLLYGKKGLKERITGSDYYPILLKEIFKSRRRVFLFGDAEETLRKISEKEFGDLLAGTQSGYDFENEKLIAEINLKSPDILFVGLGSPKQEKWVYENAVKLNCKVIICVGDGLKVFAETKKRGPVWVRKLGFEWLVRFLSEPKKFWKRYIIGIPVFIYRIFLLKLKMK